MLVMTNLTLTLTHEPQKQRKPIIYNTEFNSSNLIVKNNVNSFKIPLNQTNEVYKFTCPFRVCRSENDTTPTNYIGYTTTTLSHQFTYHVSDISVTK